MSALDVHLKCSFVIPHLALTNVSWLEVEQVVMRSVDDESKRLIQQFADRNKQNPRAGLW